MSIDGFLVLDKPTGVTSNRALQTVKRLYGARKAGHCGCLDPLASGVLPICFGQATKLSQYLLDADKKYLVTARLGEVTDTGDAEGNKLQTGAVPPLSRQSLLELMATFVGKQQQVPPMFSAIKLNGQPLYKLARQGKTVVRQPRKIEIFTMELVAWTENSITFVVHCSKGTYIRSLVVDMGEKLGCGAYVASLRRLHAGPFKEEQSIALADLLKDEALPPLEPMELALYQANTVYCSDAAVKSLCRGQQVVAPAGVAVGIVRMLTVNHQFFGVGEMTATGHIIPKKIIKFSV